MKLTIGLAAVAAVAVGVGIGIGAGAMIWAEDPPPYKPLAWYTALSIGKRTGVPLTMTSLGVTGNFLYVNLTLPADSVADEMMTRYDFPHHQGSKYSTVATANLFNLLVQGYTEHGERFNLDSIANPNAAMVLGENRTTALTVMPRAETGQNLLYMYHLTSVRTAPSGSYELTVRVPAAGNLETRTMHQRDHDHPLEFDKEDPHFHTFANKQNGADYARVGLGETVTSLEWGIEMYLNQGCPR